MKKTQKINHLNKENIQRVLKESKRPVSLKELERLLAISKSERRTIRSILKDLLKEGSVIMLKSGLYGIPREMNLQSGTLWCTRSGNGFLMPDKEGEKDIFIPSGSIKHAFHGDKVIARIEHYARGKKEGKIIKVIERKTKNITGYIKRLKDIFYVVSEDNKVPHHFIVENPSFKKMSQDALVAARIVKYPEEGKDSTCKIIKVFEGLNDVKSITQFVILKYNLQQRFKKAVDADIRGAVFS